MAKTSFKPVFAGDTIMLGDTQIGKVNDKNIITLELQPLLAMSDNGKQQWIDRQLTNAVVTNMLSLFRIGILTDNEDHFIKSNGKIYPFDTPIAIDSKVRIG